MVVPLSSERLDLVFRALGDATRRDIVRRTLGGDVSVTGLAEDYDMSFAAVQKHVAVLEKARLVHKTPSGRQRLVRADTKEIGRARACLEQLEELWRHRIGALDEILSEPEE